jgi:molybdopterin-guanine dinucleotide biosynthesis protein B
VKLLGVAGWSGSGKTTLIEAMLPPLRARGLRVSTIKHAHHGFDIDRPGKDSYRHRVAGAHEVLVASASRWALLREVDGKEPTLDELVARLSPVDLVLVEGFKSSAIAKLEVHRPGIGKAPIWPGRPDIIAVAADTALPHCDRAVLPLDAPARIVDWVIEFLGMVRGAQPAA